MAVLGTILNTETVEGSALGTISNTTTVNGVALGSILNTTDLGGEVSPSSFTSNHEYISGRDAWLYVPPGYADNSDDYPLIIFGHGYGERSSNINDVLAHGAPKYLAAGDEPPGVLIFCPQIPSGDYNDTDWLAAVSYVTTNYRVDTNRIYSTGLSGGGFMARDAVKNHPDTVAAAVVVASNIGSGWTWSAQTETAQMWVHGTDDSNQTNGMQSLLNGANAETRIVPLNTIAMWGEDHTDIVWDLGTYNRKERTDAAGTSSFDYIRWLLKHSLDPEQRATLHVTNAEETELIEDYREAARLTALLSAGAAKTALEGRLATLKTTIKNGGKFFLLDFGATSPGMSNVNNITTAQTGQGINNIVDDEGGASSIDFSVVSQFSTTPTSRMNGVTRANGPYWGFTAGMCSDGLRLEGAVNTGSCKFSTLNGSKTYGVRVYHTFGAGNFTDKSELTVTIGGVSKVQYSEVNNFLFIEFTGLSPDGSNEIHIAMDATGTGSPVRNSQVCVIELYESA